MVPSRICFHCATTGTPRWGHFLNKVLMLTVLDFQKCHWFLTYIYLFFSNFPSFLSFVSVFFFVCFCFCFCFCLFAISWATPTAYGGSQARGLIGAVAAGLHHSSWQRWILNPLSKAKDQTCNLKIPSYICFCCATMGTPLFFILLFYCSGIFY